LPEVRAAEVVGAWWLYYKICEKGIIRKTVRK